MRAGALRRSVTLLQPTSTEDAFSSGVPGWATFATVAASKRDVSDAERARAGQVAATIETRFQIRWEARLAGLNARWRLTCDGAIYDVSNVKELMSASGAVEGFELSATARAD